EARGLPEAVVLDGSGDVVECVTANLFWCRDSVVYTPALAHSGVAGVMRAWVLSQLSQLGVSCREVTAPLHELLSADEVFITNALMEVVPVCGIEDVIYTNHSLARRLQTLFLQAT
ncbi:MAG: aminotransferase class IV, partial [Aeromonadaceae bacterium]